LSPMPLSRELMGFLIINGLAVLLV
jgi:hypothetical protein